MVIPYLLTGLQLKTDRCAMTALEYGLIGPRSWWSLPWTSRCLRSGRG
jgi:hypothetical protein